MLQPGYYQFMASVNIKTSQFYKMEERILGEKIRVRFSIPVLYPPTVHPYRIWPLRTVGHLPLTKTHKLNK